MYSIGCDISHHNKNDLRGKLSQMPFVIMKASEGKTYKDPCMMEYFLELNNSENYCNNTAVGFYHYARPENNTAKDESFNFWNTVKDVYKTCLGEYRPIFFALDWEGNALSLPTDKQNKWIIDFCYHIENLSGKTPLLYCSSSTTKYLKDVAESGVKLWVAYYGKTLKNPKIYNWKDWSIWQCTSYPFDIDILKDYEIVHPE